MGDAWFTGYADELARVLNAARDCAETCESFLSSIDGSELNDKVHVLAAPAAVSRVLIELIDHPPQLVLAAVRLCRDLTSAAADALDGPANVVSSLRAVADSASDLLDAAR